MTDYLFGYFFDGKAHSSADIECLFDGNVFAKGNNAGFLGGVTSTLPRLPGMA